MNENQLRCYYSFNYFLNVLKYIPIELLFLDALDYFDQLAIIKMLFLIYYR